MSIDNDKVFEMRREAVEIRLQGYFKTGDSPELLEAMRYAVLSGGKYIRPVLALSFCGACGGDEVRMLDAACAVELLHAYTLIHDDLPSFDNADTRRGVPSVHRKFGEWQAILAGDALQAAAFEKISLCELPADRIVNMVRSLALGAGERGVCAGQALDMSPEFIYSGIESKEEIEKIRIRLYATNRLKTSALFEAACLIGVYAAGGDDKQIRAARIFAHTVGMAYQIRDDILDGGDGKITYLKIFGKDECEKLITEQTLASHEIVRGIFKAENHLMWIADKLAGRAY